MDPQIKTPGGKTYDVIFVGTGKQISMAFFSRSFNQPISFNLCKLEQFNKLRDINLRTGRIERVDAGHHFEWRGFSFKELLIRREFRMIGKGFMRQ